MPVGERPQPAPGSEGDPGAESAERAASAVEEAWADGTAGKDVHRLLEHICLLWRRRRWVSRRRPRWPGP
jgi:hypothetical protein